MMLLRWISRDGAMHLQGREAGHRLVAELGTVTQCDGGFAWETADGMWGDTAPTMAGAMRSLERRVRR